MIDLQITEISQLVFLFFFFVCVLFLVYVLLAFIAELNKLRMRLSNIEMELETAQLDLPPRRGRVSFLKKEVPSAKRVHQHLNEYSAELSAITQKIEEGEREESEEQKRRHEDREVKVSIKQREWDF